MDLINNTQLSLTDLFKKRDAIESLILLGYDLRFEYDHVQVAIKDAVDDIQGGTTE